MIFRWVDLARDIVHPLGIVIILSTHALAQASSLSLEQQLAAESPEQLARAAREQGDPARGAAVFFQPQLACTTCHEAGPAGPPLGPDLTGLGKDATDAYLIESILAPSKSVKKGYETVTIAQRDGSVLTGILAEQTAAQLVVRDPAQGGRLVQVARADVDEVRTERTSMMPPGLVNQLRSRQQFLDLVRYLREIADHGAARARALRPAPALLASPPVPAYEQQIDHARLIGELGPQSYERGEAIYNRVCINCHGTKDRAGSLPTSLRFSSGKFKTGSDPYAIYRTLTYGYQQMPPQSWMVPRQKYDVIHYIREKYLKDDNRSQYAQVDRGYLERLPRGNSLGPAPLENEPWREMDYGSSLMLTVEVGDGGDNFAYKGIAVRLDPGTGGISQGRAWAVYDHDTMRLAAAWEGAGFIDWNGINFNGRHEIHPRSVGRVIGTNDAGPGWANPENGSFDDPRLLGRDQRRYGPLPRSWAKYRGTYYHGDRIIVSYTVGQAEILDTTGLEPNPSGGRGTLVARTLNIGRSSHDLTMRAASAGPAIAIVGGKGTSLVERDGRQLLQIPAAATPAALKVLMAADGPTVREAAIHSTPPEDLTRLTHGGPGRWPESQHAAVVPGRDDGPFALDVLAHPVANPWRSRMRFTGFDFLPGGRQAVVCDWDGDVWRVDGIDGAGTLAWRRIASGLFQPLGLKVVDGRIYVTCRDQIAELRDLNGDGEIDFVACFNDDHQVTDHFHEFAMDLERDAAGRFYYAKAARHGKTALVPQHGTLLRVSADGSRTEILATGFRAPNGVCLNSDGTYFMTDQEGHWIPKNRINWVREGHFYGNMWGYHGVTDPADTAMDPPLCWITNAFDRSPAQLLWVESPTWGPLKGSLLSLSYGYGKIFIVPHERVGDRMQGGVCALPVAQAPTGLIRGRFHPRDGQLYTCGMFAWAGNQQQPGGFYRVRYSGRPIHVPTGLRAKRSGMAITFSGPLDRRAASDASRYHVKIWSIKRTEDYGSQHHDEQPLNVTAARLSDDGRTLFLEIPEIRPTRCMEIAYSVQGADGTPVDGLIHNTIHELTD